MYQHENKIIVLVAGKLGEAEKTGRDLRKLVRNAYEVQEGKRRGIENADKQYKTVKWLI